VQECLEELLFGGGESLSASLGGRLQDAAVLLAGAPGDVMSGITHRLTAQGIGRELVLLCDYL
jgi:predicted amino acid dehydrogenase